jgi:hypothetical protein
LNKLDAWTCLHTDTQQTDVHVYSDSSSDDDDDGKMILLSLNTFYFVHLDMNTEKDNDDDDDDDSSSSDDSDDESIEIEAPDSIPNETDEDYYLRTRDFWLTEARKELKINDSTDDSVRIQHLAKQMSKLFFQS